MNKKFSFHFYLILSVLFMAFVLIVSLLKFGLSFSDDLANLVLFIASLAVVFSFMSLAIIRWQISESIPKPLFKKFKCYKLLDFNPTAKTAVFMFTVAGEDGQPCLRSHNFDVDGKNVSWEKEPDRSDIGSKYVVTARKERLVLVSKNKR